MKLLGFLNATLIAICLALDFSIRSGHWSGYALASEYSVVGGDPFRLAKTGDFSEFATTVFGMALFSTLLIALLTYLRNKLVRSQ
jgi:LPXTG-motif cell wall-anchored protein